MNPATTGAPAATPTSGPWNAWRIAWPPLFWALWGAWLAVSDLRNEEVQPAVLLLLVGAFVLGAARPRWWWAWALALGAWVPAEPLVSRVAGITPTWPANAGALVAFVPALVGGAMGAAAARLRPRT